MTATFDVPGVRKEDMHVSYCGRHLVVSWRTSRVTERREGDVLVREREVVGNNQIISLADGTQVSLADALVRAAVETVYGSLQISGR